MFHYFLSGDSKQYSATTNAHSNHLIEFLKIKNKLMSALSTIWENADGFADQYRCATALYLMLVLSQRHSIMFDQGISAPGNDKEVVDGINYIDKRYMYLVLYIDRLTICSYVLLLYMGACTNAHITYPFFSGMTGL